MTKEELKEMIDATIVGNGKQEITGSALNLALNAIVDSAGGGLDTVYYIVEDMSGASPISTIGEIIPTQLENNKQVYEKLSNLFTNTLTSTPVTLDLSVYNSLSAGEYAGINVPASIAMFKIPEEMEGSTLSSNPFDVYNPGQIAIQIYGTQQVPMYEEFSFWLTPDGICVPMNSGGPA